MFGTLISVCASSHRPCTLHDNPLGLFARIVASIFYTNIGVKSRLVWSNFEVGEQIIVHNNYDLSYYDMTLPGWH